MHLTTINEKGIYEFEKEQENVNGGLKREEGREKCCIIL